MNNPKISIIVPVYKAEKYLHRCLDSILQQTFTDWECILVDDGSPDRSGAICDEYATKDCRFRVFHKVNGGVSSARNLGLDNAKGEWITFLDADDAFEDGFLDVSKDRSGYDLLIGIEKRSDGVSAEISLAEGLYDGSDIKRFFEQYLICHILRTPWGKLFRRDLIELLRFDESLHLGEDTLFCLRYYVKCTCIKVDTAKGYCYSVSDCSAKYQLDVDYAIHTLKLLSEEYEKLGCTCKRFCRFSND